MKNYIALTILIVLAFSLSACDKKPTINNSKSENSNEKVQAEAKEENQSNRLNIEKYNKFVNESYSSIFKNYIMDTKEKNLIYSPYSYKMALEGVGKITNSFDNDNYLSEAIKSNMSQNLSSVKTKNLVMLNKMNFDTKDKSISLVSFPDEAKKLSINTQKEVLGHVLLDPDYSTDTNFVSLNATKFESKWEKPFEIVEKGEFNAFNDILSSKDFLYGEIDKVAYVDEDVEVGSKKLKDDGSYVYFISPKKFEKENLEKIASKIPNYIEDINAFISQGFAKETKNVKEYDEVNISIPKIDAESTIDILNSEINGGHTQLANSYKYKDNIKSALKEGSINSILQVANMKLDEKGVKAEAVTEIVEMTSLAPEEKKDILDINCDHPHFVVCVSQGIITFIGFIGY